MKVLLAGGAGDVGQHLVRHFLRFGSQVTVLDPAAASPALAPGGDLELIPSDLADTAAVAAAVQGADIVVNLAWSFADEPARVSAATYPARSICWRRRAWPASNGSSTPARRRCTARRVRRW